MKWLKRFSLALLVLLVIAFLIPFLIPFNAYAPQLERLASDRLKEPVHIRTLSGALLPRPAIKLEGVTVGQADALAIGSIRVSLEWLSLLRTVKIVHAVEIDTVVITQDWMDKLPSMVKSDGGPQTVAVRELRLQHIKLAWPNFAVGPFSGTVDLGDGAFRSAVAETDDTKLKLHIQPAQSGYRIEADAKNWQMPVGPPIVFEQLSALGTLVDGQLDVSQLVGRFYGGTLDGKATLGWKDGWRLNGVVKGKQVELKDIVPLFSRDTRLSGKLSADTNFVLKGKTAGQMLGHHSVDSRFRIDNGVLYNIDLASAVKSIVSKGTRGGQTHFDEFTGVMRVENRAFHFSELKISSGLLRADGNVNITPTKQVEGRINVEMKGTANLINVPLMVSGDLSDPLLRPTNAALAGAAAGTAVLGPGLGTSLGIKAGEFTEKLFK
jgi:uncharacterized protein involved in outer membrane biogenesis